MHKGEKPNVVAGAYSNSFKGTKETALYDIDATIGALVKQAPPNDGVLNAIGKLGVKVDDRRLRHLVGRHRQERSLADGRRLAATASISRPARRRPPMQIKGVERPGARHRDPARRAREDDVRRMIQKCEAVFDKIMRNK